MTPDELAEYHRTCGPYKEQARTGRTTRMLARAVWLCNERPEHRVYVIAHNQTLANQFRARFRDLCKEKVGRLLDNIQFCSAKDLAIDWGTMTIASHLHQPSHLLVDHFVIEKRFRPMLKALHEFDLAMSANGTWLDDLPGREEFKQEIMQEPWPKQEPPE